MFEDFENDAEAQAEDRKRMRRSMFASGGVLILLLALGATMAVTTGIVRPRAPEAEVTFDDVPMEEEPPPPPTEPPPPRPRSTRPAARVAASPIAPTEIPNEVPEESDQELAEAGDTGAIEGTTDGVEGGDPNGSGAPQTIPSDEEARLAAMPLLAHEDIELPRRIGGCARPDYPQEARSRGLQGRVVARVRINEDGSVGAVDFLEGDAVFHELTRRCIEAMQFAPARLSDGTPVAHARMLTFPFRLTNL